MLLFAYVYLRACTRVFMLNRVMLHLHQVSAFHPTVSNTFSCSDVEFMYHVWSLGLCGYYTKTDCLVTAGHGIFTLAVNELGWSVFYSLMYIQDRGSIAASHV